MSLTPSLSDVASIPDDVIVRRMVALFDYDPWESSPNMDSEVRTIMTHEPLYVLTTLYKSILIYCFKYNNVVCGNIFKTIFLFYFCLSKVELGFRSGDIIYVLGEMDQDGFYYVSFISTITMIGA